MTPEEFRRAGHALVDWIADYRASIENRPVRAQTQPDDVRKALPNEPPDGGDSIDALLQDLDAHIVPHLTQVQHPMHFGWFPSNAALASVLGDLASGGVGALGISWESAPALTELEQVVCDWMRQLLGLSDAWQGCIQDTASTACTTALIAARERSSDYALDRGGMQAVAQPLMVYTTAEAHSSVIKSALIAGFGRDCIRKIEVDSQQFAMRPDRLRAALEADVAAGRVPCAVIGSVGTTGVTAIDPIKGLAHLANEFGCWFHVDAAMAGSAMLLRECRWMWSGVEESHSISLNPHKWMGTILDCSLLYVREPELLTRVYAATPAYLRSRADGAVVQYRDWGIPLGRRFRALKLWFHLRIDGPDAIRARLREDLELAQWLRDQASRTPDWELAAPTPLQTVCMVHCPPELVDNAAALNAHTAAWVEQINASGEAFLSTTELNGRLIVRVSIGVEATAKEHVVALWETMQRVAVSNR
ncbi:MAG: pyridoxal-dependent decarboxylase [Pseudomonadota bacterium]